MDEPHTDLEGDGLDLGEIGPAAFEAAADFVRAVWEHRRNLTIIDAFGYDELLASWSGGDVYERDSDTAVFLSGDLELPEDVELAAAALERLVPLYRSPANHYRSAPAARR